jgi:hypothetical protein
LVRDREQLLGMLRDCETGRFAHLDDKERNLIVESIKSRLATLSDSILEATQASRLD